MIIRLPVPLFPITLAAVRHDPCLSSTSSTIERLCGPEGAEVRLSALRHSLYLTRGLTPRT